MVSSETVSIIERILSSDLSVTEEEKTAIMKVCKSKPRRKLVTAKEAMEQLQISRPTLRAYVKQGLIHQINISSRKVRFDMAEIEHIASYGTESMAVAE